MEPKPGYKTTELWLGVFSAIVAVLVGYGYLNSDQGELWIGLAAAVVPAVVTTVYTWSRTRVKQASNGHGG